MAIISNLEKSLMQTQMFSRFVWLLSRPRAFGRVSKPMVIRDPKSMWRDTSTMGNKELVDAVDKAARLRHATAHESDLWERLSCRAQALAPDFQAQDLCRVLFAFHRARRRELSLLETACECIVEERPGQDLSANDIALVLKALSKHEFAHILAVDHLLHRARQIRNEFTPADISQLLAALIRLGLEDHLCSKHPGLVDTLFECATNQLGDAYLPCADLSNLCAAAALLPPSMAQAHFLAAVGRRLHGAGIAFVPPKDLARRLQSIVVFDQGLLKARDEINPMAHPNGSEVPLARELLGEQGVRDLCKSAVEAFERRGAELNASACVSACEALVELASGHEDVQSSSALLALLIQRLAALPAPLLVKTSRVSAKLAQVVPPSETLPSRVLFALSAELKRRPAEALSESERLEIEGHISAGGCDPIME
eukprot:gnl/MRDRNA2_/MRDRNA2_158830_c0_seq1.p1 gnl/MRDRNA2_/MRDRNA2_158830_c0~~gnl/MRDRNA2_/MRDRNA2_158830_c0_seq1.p1  ORF type:complete len:446 (+),score=66.70 gnl/MRDRNA2_/MRDRNA2_158830_c0_seq1:59-1339(+)